MSISVHQTGRDEPGARKHYCSDAGELIALRVDGVNEAKPVFCPRCGGMVPAEPERHWFRHSWNSPEYDGPLCAHGYPDVTCLDLARNDMAANHDFRFGTSIPEFAAAALAERFGCAPVLRSWVRPCVECRQDTVERLAPAIEYELRLMGMRLDAISKRVSRRAQRVRNDITDLHRCRMEFEAALADAIEAPPPERHGFVYLIGHTEAVKIGFSERHPRFARLGQLQTGHDQHLQILGLVLGTRDDEARLHRQFAKHRRKGEWFSPVDEIFRYFREYGIQV